MSPPAVWRMALLPLAGAGLLIAAIPCVPASAGERASAVAQAQGADADYWARVKDSDDPLLLEMYIRAFPGGAFVPQAHARLRELQAREGAAGRGEGETAQPAAPSAGAAATAGTTTAGTTTARAYPPGEKGWLGVEVRALQPSEAQQRLTGRRTAVEVVTITDYGPARAAGLQSGDVIAALNGGEVGTLPSFVETVANSGAGAQVVLTVLRGDTPFDLPVRLGGRFTDNLAAAQAGNADAQLQVGFAYATGTGVEQDAAKGFEWYMKAAAQGHLHALHNVGNAYFYGRGVAKDERQAIEWYRRAAERGHVNAQTHMGYAYANGIGVARNDHQAVEWYRKAVAQNEPYAMNNLALFYEEGRGGLRKSREQATGLLRRSAALGNELALQNLEKRGITVYDPADIQRALADLGLDPGPIDGKPGPKTAAAIRQAQDRLGLAVDGRPSLDLLRALQRAVRENGATPATAVPPGRREPPRGGDLGDLDSLD